MYFFRTVKYLQERMQWLFDVFFAVGYHLYMEKGLIKSISKYVEYLEDICSRQRGRADDLKGLEGYVLREIVKPNGRKYYKYRRPGSENTKYLGKEDCEDVEAIKEAHYYKYSIRTIESNLKICRKTLQKLGCTDYDSVNEVLPNVYKGATLRSMIPEKSQKTALEWKRKKEAFKESRGPWYPEDLTSTTADGSKVRSKSEALIYNQYLWNGCTFVYELPLEVELGIWRHPDFTLLCETDWTSVIRHDHQGRYGFDEDRERYNRDMYMYWKKGFIPGVNIFYTFDDPKGGLDISVVQKIIDSTVRPV